MWRQRDLSYLDKAELIDMCKKAAIGEEKRPHNLISRSDCYMICCVCASFPIAICSYQKCFCVFVWQQLHVRVFSFLFMFDYIYLVMLASLILYVSQNSFGKSQCPEIADDLFEMLKMRFVNTSNFDWYSEDPIKVLLNSNQNGSNGHKDVRHVQLFIKSCTID